MTEFRVLIATRTTGIQTAAKATITLTTIGTNDFVVGENSLAIQTAIGIIVASKTFGIGFVLLDSARRCQIVSAFREIKMDRLIKGPGVLGNTGHWISIRTQDVNRTGISIGYKNRHFYTENRNFFFILKSTCDVLLFIVAFYCTRLDIL